MTKFFYLDASGQKQGPVNNQQLRAMVTQGIITPQTQLETESGHKGVAGQIKGLFDIVPPSPEVQAIPVALPEQNTTASTGIPLENVVIGGVITLFVIVVIVVIVASKPVSSTSHTTSPGTSNSNPVVSTSNEEKQETDTKTSAYHTVGTPEYNEMQEINARVRIDEINDKLYALKTGFGERFHGYVGFSDLERKIESERLINEKLDLRRKYNIE